MGTEKRAERMASRFTGWKRKLVKRLLVGCGNCPHRLKCGSMILNSTGHGGAMLLVFSQLQRVSKTYKDEPTQLAIDVADFLRENCAECPKLACCLSNLALYCERKPEGLNAERELADKVKGNLLREDLPNRIQHILNELSLSESRLKYECLWRFINCRSPLLKR